MPGFCLVLSLCSRLGGTMKPWAVSSRNGLMAIRVGFGGMANSLGGWLKSFQLSRLSSRYSAHQVMALGPMLNAALSWGRGQTSWHSRSPRSMSNACTHRCHSWHT